MLSMFEKIDVVDVVRSHFATFKHASSQASGAPEEAWGDWALFIGVPLGLAFFVHALGVDVTRSVEAMIGGLSILTGLLFNLLVLLLQDRTQVDLASLAVRKADGSTPPVESPHAKQLRRETYNNAAYAIVVALVALVFLVAVASKSETRWFASLVGACSIFLVAHFTLTLGMVLKRINSLFADRV